MKKRWVFITLALIAIILTGCGTSRSSGKQSKNSKDKDTFTFAISGDPDSLNPINVRQQWGLTAVNMIYSPLLRILPDGTQEMELAEDIIPAEDGKSLTAKLKDNIKWSDGEKFTADDVVFTYNQKVKKENGSSDNLWINDEPIVAEKVDDLTVKFSFSSVSAPALENIVTETYIIPEHVHKNDTDFSVNEFAETPVGTGPYKLIEYKRGEYLQFEANENYYGGTPTIKNAILRIIPNADTRKVALQNGEVDAAYVLPHNIEDLNSSDTSTYEFSANAVRYFALNLNSEKLKDQKVRQAILYALNKDELNKAAYLSDEHYTNVYSILPSQNSYKNDNVEKYETNIEKSKSLLKEAGVDKLTINIGFNSDDPVQTIQTTLLQEQLQKAGITLELAGGDSAAILSEMKKPDTTKYDLFMYGYIMGSDPDTYGCLFKTGGASNYFHYSSEVSDGLFEKGAIELDEAKRKEIYNDLQEQIAEDAIIYPIVDNKQILAVNNRIGNIDDTGLIPIYTFKDLSKLSIK